MKISQLAAYRDMLQDLQVRSDDDLKQEMSGLIDHMIRQSIQMPSRLDVIKQNHQSVLDSLERFNQSINDLQEELLEQIKLLEPGYLAQSYRMYEDSIHLSYEYIQNRRFTISPDTEQFIQARVQAHSDMRHPGMLIRPGHEKWIEHMVACDPLYIVDTDHDLLWPARSRFNPQYQNRLRYYVIKDNDQDPMMRDLPDGQFGFVLAYNFFHYTPFELMRRYLEEIYQKLRPGGLLAITFNDCDHKGAIELAEKMTVCYTPGRMVRSLCDRLGYMVEQTYQVNAAVSWMELRKPGQFTSIKGGQSLAKIVAKSK